MRELTESLRGYAVSLAVLAAIGVGLFALVSSQHSGTPIGASSPGGSQTLAAAAARAAKLSAQTSAAQAAFDRQVAHDSARDAQQNAALGAQEGHGTSTPSGTHASAPAAGSPGTANAVGAPSAAGSASPTAPMSSPPASNATAGAGATASTTIKLTASEVRAAVDGGAALARECADVRRPDWAAAERDLGSAVYGERSLDHALRKDPDTLYQGAGSGAVTMRKYAISVAVPANLNLGGGCQVLTQNLLSTLNGLPS